MGKNAIKLIQVGVFVLALGILPTLAISAPDFAQIERWKAEVKGEEYMAGTIDSIEVETAKYFVVRQDAGTSCAAGSHWLFVECQDIDNRIMCQHIDNKVL